MDHRSLASLIVSTRFAQTNVLPSPSSFRGQPALTLSHSQAIQQSHEQWRRRHRVILKDCVAAAQVSLHVPSASSFFSRITASVSLAHQCRRIEEVPKNESQLAASSPSPTFPAVLGLRLHLGALPTSGSCGQIYASATGVPAACTSGGGGTGVFPA